MCGIVGEFRFDNKKIDKNLFQSKLNSIKHRGPDGEGSWSNDFCILGHVRLSIIDLSENGSQPMISSNKNVITFNGEIYNFNDLKKKLSKNLKFKSSSDTEVLLNLIENFELEILNDLLGMFAFAYYDENKKELIVVRDQLGIKPVYYHKTNDRIIFGSEIKTILMDVDYKTDYDQQALKEHMLLGYSLEDQTLFKDIKRLEPGHLLKINKKGITKIKYYNLLNDINYKSSQLDNLENLIYKSVDLHAISDVDLGIMLSGGIDSNLLLYFLKKTGNLDSSFTAFNAGLEKGNDSDQRSLMDERMISSMISKKFDINLKKINVFSKDFIDIKTFVKINEEPVCNPSGFLINEICNDAKKSNNKVLLSGHGGDEIFAGYRRHVASKLLYYLHHFSFVFKLIPLFFSLTDGFYRVLYALKNPKKCLFGLSAIGLRLIKSGKVLKNDYINDKDLEIISKKFNKPVNNLNISLLKKSMILEFFGYLGSQNLINMDKFSMFNSIEVRVPFLNTRLLRKGFSYKDNQLINKFKNKSILRNLALKNLPKEVFNHKKSGFGPSLRSLLYSKESINLLTDNITRKRNIIDIQNVKRILFSNRISDADIMQLLNLAFIEQWFRLYIDK